MNGVVSPVWIIEAGVFGPNSERLRAAIAKQGMECYVVSQHTLAHDLTALRGGLPLADDACVVCLSSFSMARFVQQKRDWKPGSFCAFDNLACSTYYAYFGRYLLNARYVLLPGAEALRQQNFLYEVFGRDDAVFIRPDKAEKLFTGQCVTQSDFAAALEFARHRPTQIIVIAAKRAVRREWRLVVVESKVVAASQYYVEGKKNVLPGCPAEVQAFADEILREIDWRPDPVFSMDICESDGRLFLLELNSFGCAGLYGCDLDAVVEAVSELAKRQHSAENGESK